MAFRRCPRPKGCSKPYEWYLSLFVPSPLEKKIRPENLWGGRTGVSAVSERRVYFLSVEIFGAFKPHRFRYQEPRFHHRSSYDFNWARPLEQRPLCIAKVGPTTFENTCALLAKRDEVPRTSCRCQRSEARVESQGSLLAFA